MFVHLFVCLFWTMCHEQQTNPTLMCLCLYFAWDGMCVRVCVWMEFFCPGNRDWSRNVKTKLPQWSLSVFDICPHKTDKAWRNFFSSFDYGIRVVTTDIHKISSTKKNCVPYCESLPHSIIHSFVLFLCRSMCEYSFASSNHLLLLFSPSHTEAHTHKHIFASFKTCFAIPLLHFSCSLSLYAMYQA